MLTTSLACGLKDMCVKYASIVNKTVETHFNVVNVVLP